MRMTGIRACALFALVFISALVVGAALTASSTQPPAAPALVQVDPLGSSVKVILDAGHGSGTHIGGGLILTAAHVVEDAPSVRILTSDGHNLTATRVWMDRAHDVALLMFAGGPVMPVSPLYCAPLALGQSITLTGNPLSLEFIVTRGYVAGKSRQVGPWANVVIIDGTVAGGMSGGAVMDSEQRVVGITVGAMSPRGSLVAITTVVPADVICRLIQSA